MPQRPTRREMMAGAVAASVPCKAPSENNKPEEAESVAEEYHPFPDKFLFSHKDITHPVYKAGTGPGVLLMHELPGMVPEFWRLATWLDEAGFTVYAPDLYADQLEGAPSAFLTGNSIRACISREIHLFARNDSSPVTTWLRALAARMHEECGGPGVGAVGLCMTGNFALSLVLEEGVIAPVAAEPSLPLGIGGRTHAALAISSAERQALQERTDIDVMALRFEGDPVCRKARFDALEDLIGQDRLKRIELPDCAKNPDGNRFPHAVLTRDLIDEDGTLTRKARDCVVDFLAERLSA